MLLRQSPPPSVLLSHLESGASSLRDSKTHSEGAELQVTPAQIQYSIFKLRLTRCFCSTLFLLCACTMRTTPASTVFTKHGFSSFDTHDGESRVEDTSPPLGLSQQHVAHVAHVAHVPQPRPRSRTRSLAAAVPSHVQPPFPPLGHLTRAGSRL